ncbi:MEDS domain-containing protein [Amycolatopsis sp. Hca4]|uniref:MEDS domain-containing protein n=1 Tax=Amycolatopsis sp. Hca4 TaxID=2742131 RepID=UPI00158FD0AF|nr:MEDS domain-containing protein [Amycolatopsis sp. Hca4]
MGVKGSQVQILSARRTSHVYAGRRGFRRIRGPVRRRDPGHAGLTELFRYEAALNDFTSRYPQAFLCVYDISRYRENIVLDLLKTHPQVLMCGVLLENPYYLPLATGVPPPTSGRGARPATRS